MSEEVIYSKVLAGYKKSDVHLRYNRGDVFSFFLAYHLMHCYTVSHPNLRYGLHETDKYRRDDAK